MVAGNVTGRGSSGNHHAGGVIFFMYVPALNFNCNKIMKVICLEEHSPKCFFTYVHKRINCVYLQISEHELLQY